MGELAGGFHPGRISAPLPASADDHQVVVKILTHPKMCLEKSLTLVSKRLLPDSLPVSLPKLGYQRMFSILLRREFSSVLPPKSRPDKSLPKKRSKYILVADHFPKITRGFFLFHDLPLPFATTKLALRPVTLLLPACTVVGSSTTEVVAPPIPRPPEGFLGVTLAEARDLSAGGETFQLRKIGISQLTSPILSPKLMTNSCSV